MANKLPVKFYYNTMPGMPQITNQRSDTVNVLDCVLVNGTPLATVNSITFADGVCTATTAAAHGFIVDMVIEISGATQDEFNGEWRITDATTTTFKYVPVVPPAVGNASGSLKVRIPPLGYEIAFSDVNRRVYRSKDVTSNRPFIKVDTQLKANWDANYGIVSRVTAAKMMTDIDTFTDGRFPFDPANPTRNDVTVGTGNTAQPGWHYWTQSTAGTNFQTAPGTGTRDWTVVGDDRAFYFIIAPNSTYGLNFTMNYGFGEFNSFRKNDPYNLFLVATDYAVNANSGYYGGYGYDFMIGNTGAGSGMILCKNAFNVGDYTNFSLHHTKYRGDATISNRHNGVPFPNQSDFSVRFATRYICDFARGDLRGTMPGNYFIQQATPFGHRSIVNDVYIDGTNEKRKFLTLRSTYSTNTSNENTLLAYDITGPWR